MLKSIKKYTAYCFGLLVVVSALSSCNDDEPNPCTEEFRTVGIEITGKTLDNWYTVRESTQDTFLIGTSFQNTYAVLDDNFQRTLANKQEDFAFHGVISDSVWVKEVFVISADACHINYISGKLKVVL